VQHECVERAEERTVRANSERKRHNRNQREPRRFSELAKSEFEIVHIIRRAAPRLDQRVSRDVQGSDMRQKQPVPARLRHRRT